MVHTPVLLKETINLLAPADGGIYVDGTLGMGGHSRVILEKSRPGGRVIGLDRDLDALAQARKNLASYDNRISFFHRNFIETRQVLTEIGIEYADGLLLDLGVSSMQLDSGSRGFSFKGSNPLDMRMDPRSSVTAAKLVNTESEDELANIFYYYGEEQQSRRIAARIVAERKKTRIETTDRLADIVAQAIPKRFHPKKIHVATKVFQALRIAVNQELENLSEILDAALTILKPGGIICIISFHSLEDRLVKCKFREDPVFDPLTKKPIVPEKNERQTNPRARSAKLRAARLLNMSKLEG